MIIYQVKIKVEERVEQSWLKWMKQVHVPDVLATGLACAFDMLKSQDDASTYYFHYKFNTASDFESYQNNHAPRLKAHPQEKFPGMFTAERQILTHI